MKIEVCLSPALYPFYKQEGDIVIVVDIFRATTTICTMLHNGATSVIPVSTIEDAKSYKEKGYIVGGERNTKKIEFADFGNSPSEYKREVVEEKEIVFTTTNGTQAIEAAKGCKMLFIGAFSNIDTLANKCTDLGGRTVIVCAGWKNKINLEDTLFAGAIIEKLALKGDITYESDSARIALGLWQKAKDNPVLYLKESDHYGRLVKNGAINDVSYCFENNTTPVLPLYCKKENKIRAIM